MNNNHVLFILLVLVLVWIDTSTSASVSHQRQLAEGGVVMNKKCIDQERHALVDFKAHILRDPDGWLSTWRVEDEEDCCKWSGVTCNNQAGHVTELDLAYRGLEGKVSPSLLNLTYLTHLDLLRNFFTGTIPTSIGSLTRLRYLDLSGNNFNGTIPTSIGCLTELRYLHLSNNYFTETVPQELGNLANLEHLSLGGDFGSLAIENLTNWLSRLSELHFLDMSGTSLAKADNWVNVILSLKKLSSLYLNDCELSHVMHPYSSSSSIVNSSSLSSNTFIDLSKNNLNSSMYHWLFPLTSNKLDGLDLSYNLLDGIPKYIGNLCSLRELYFYNNSVEVILSDFFFNLSGCTSLTLQMLEASRGQFIGSLSDDIQKFSSLEMLYLSDNHLNGSISEKLWELPYLKTLDLSSNFLRGIPSEAHISNDSYVQDIDLSSCKLLGPRFPKWIQNLKNLTRLNIADTMISDTIPREFWNMWPSQLSFLNLSSNNITGKVPDLISNFNSEYLTIDLSSNNFYGPVANVPSSLELLDLSRNRFSRGISFLCKVVDGVLKYLDLAYNSFSGPLPDCLWHFKHLIVLDLGNNKLSGRIPRSVESLKRLEILYLYNNTFSGEFPLSLQNCTRLIFLHLGVNMFSGNVPYWIGEKLAGLKFLSLTSNDFFGTIPLQLCQLVNLQILDLSMNKLSGNIPSCVDNLTAMVQDGFSPRQQVQIYQQPIVPIFLYHAMIKWQGSVREFSNTLRFMKLVDLSSNGLTGQIPPELGNLCQLLALNLSSNALQGEIPRKIVEMKHLLTLDLSNNDLSGELSSSMYLMTSLNYLDVSHNNLSGRIPSSTQLQSFDPSRYNGNAGLCGLPLTKYCPGDEEFQVPHTVGESEGDGEDTNELERWFYIGGATGFPIGFRIVCCALLLNRSGRHAFFNFLDSLRDWGYVKMLVFTARVAHL